MKHPPWLFRWDFLLCFPFFQDVLRECKYLATGFCYNKYRKLKKWAIHSFLVISHIGRNIILRTSDSVTLLSLKHYFQRNECPGPDCISDFLFGFGWETEPRGLFVLTGHIRNSQTVYNSPHGHTESTGSVGTFGNKSQRLWLGPLTQLSSPRLGFGPWAQAWLSLSQGIGTMKLRLVLDSLNLCLRFFFFYHAKGHISFLTWFIQSPKLCNKHLLIVYCLRIFLFKLCFSYSLTERSGI